MMKSAHYFDYNASCLMHPKVAKAYTKILAKQANPSSPHAFGRQAREMIESAREKLAAFVGAARPSQIIFTGSATESNNMLLRSVQQQLQPGEHIIVSAIEHPCILDTIQVLASEGVQVKIAKVNRCGYIDLDYLDTIMDEQTAFVSIMLANNETGVIQPLAEIAERCRRYNALLHTDASQVLGRLPVDFQVLDVDMASFSAHKCYGPQGVGALYLKDVTSLKPLMFGGSQEQLLRPGTQNVAGIHAFGLAIDVVTQLGEAEQQRLASLKQYFLDQLAKAGISFHHYGANTDTLINTCNLAFGNHTGERVATNLDLVGFAVGTGAACSTGSIDASHVLLAMGYSEEEALRGLRFSMGYATDQVAIDALVDALKAIVS